VQRGLGQAGLTGRTAPVHVDDLGDFDGAFICNSATPACAVASIGDHAFATPAAMIDRLAAAWASNPLQPI
jgi:branched-subunit amino acid aminotransferase/4-amino-4-deoxychorismate lyase